MKNRVIAPRFYHKLIGVLIFLFSSVCLYSQVLTDEQLFSNAQSAREKRQWLELSNYLYAYIQRQPQAMATDQNHRNKVQYVYKWTVETVNFLLSERDKYYKKVQELTSPPGKGRTTSGLEVSPPPLDPPKKTKLPATSIQLSPPNGSVFNYFPRTTSLNWRTVPGAVSYTIEIDCYNCCESGKWCTEVGRTVEIVRNIVGTCYTFDFIGAQPGRWRVSAINATGQVITTSIWWNFRYSQ